MYAALTGEPVEADVVQGKGESSLPGEFVDDHEALGEEIKFGYCTEFIVSHRRPEMREGDVVRLRKRLERIGDCVLVISDLSVVKVHVHTNDPGKAIQYALELGAAGRDPRSTTCLKRRASARRRRPRRRRRNRRSRRNTASWPSRWAKGWRTSSAT